MIVLPYMIVSMGAMASSMAAGDANEVLEGNRDSLL